MVTCLAINETRHLPNELRWAGITARASNLLGQRRHSSLKSTGSQGAEGFGLAFSEGSQSALTALDVDMRSSDELEDEGGRARTGTVDTEDSVGEFPRIFHHIICVVLMPRTRLHAHVRLQLRVKRASRTTTRAACCWTRRCWNHLCRARSTTRTAAGSARRSAVSPRGAARAAAEAASKAAVPTPAVGAPSRFVHPARPSRTFMRMKLRPRTGSYGKRNWSSRRRTTHPTCTPTSDWWKEAPCTLGDGARHIAQRRARQAQRRT